MPTGKLPASGKKIWEEVYDTALKGSCKGDKQCAAGSAWKAVKRYINTDSSGLDGTYLSTTFRNGFICSNTTAKNQ